MTCNNCFCVQYIGAEPRKVQTQIAGKVASARLSDVRNGGTTCSSGNTILLPLHIQSVRFFQKNFTNFDGHKS